MPDNNNLILLHNVQEVALYSYVPNEERVVMYIEWMQSCKTMKQVINHVIFYILMHEKLVTYETAMRKDFYTIIEPFIQHIRKSIPITTWRDGIVRLRERVKIAKTSEENSIHDNSYLKT